MDASILVAFARLVALARRLADVVSSERSRWRRLRSPAPPCAGLVLVVFVVLGCAEANPPRPPSADDHGLGVSSCAPVSVSPQGLLSQDLLGVWEGLPHTPTDGFRIVFGADGRWRSWQRDDDGRVVKTDSGLWWAGRRDMLHMLRGEVERVQEVYVDATRLVVSWGRYEAWPPELRRMSCAGPAGLGRRTDDAGEG